LLIIDAETRFIVVWVPNLLARREAFISGGIPRRFALGFAIGLKLNELSEKIGDF